MEDLDDIQANLARISQQMTIIQDYITLKFGLDFEIFCERRINCTETLNSKLTRYTQSPTAKSLRNRRRARTSISKSVRNSQDLQTFSSSRRSLRATHSAIIDYAEDHQRDLSDYEDESLEIPTEVEEEPVIKSEPSEVYELEVEAATEDDFFNELNQPDDNSEDVEIGQGCSSVSTLQLQPQLGASLEGAKTCLGSRQHMKTKTPSTIHDIFPLVEIETTSPDLKIFPSALKRKYACTYKGFVYIPHHSATDKHIFRCSRHNSGCRARLYLALTYKSVISEFKADEASHNHKIDFKLLSPFLIHIVILWTEASFRVFVCAEVYDNLPKIDFSIINSYGSDVKQIIGFLEIVSNPYVRSKTIIEHLRLRLAKEHPEIRLKDHN